jgi:hypothetical protein
MSLGISWVRKINALLGGILAEMPPFTFCFFWNNMNTSFCFYVQCMDIETKAFDFMLSSARTVAWT